MPGFIAETRLDHLIMGFNCPTNALIYLSYICRILISLW